MTAQSRYLTDFNIAGMRFWEGALVLNKLKPGKRLTLTLEADNPYDPDAIIISRKGTKIGYVPRTKNALPAQLLRFGHGNVLECRILKIDKNAEPWKQIRVGLYVTDATHS